MFNLQESLIAFFVICHPDSYISCGISILDTLHSHIFQTKYTDFGRCYCLSTKHIVHALSTENQLQYWPPGDCLCAASVMCVYLIGIIFMWATGFEVICYLNLPTPMLNPSLDGPATVIDVASLCKLNKIWYRPVIINWNLCRPPKLD